jgi:hypothetical protein
MNIVLETQMKLFNPEIVQAADSRFFNAETYMAPQLAYELIERLDEIAAISNQAGQELVALPPEAHEAYRENMRKFYNGAQDETMLRDIGYMQDLLERKNGYSDAASAIRRASSTVVHKIMTAFDPGFGWINNRPYWVGMTPNRKPVFCGTDENDEVIYFGANGLPKQVEGREATVHDYVRLLLDIRKEAETTATH